MSDTKTPAALEPQATQTFVVYVEDKPGALDRVASAFRRRSFNIASLSVGHTERPDVSRMTIVMEGDRQDARRAQANLHKIVSVLQVENVSSEATVERNLALIKIRAEPEFRSEILQICEVFRARIVDVGTEALIVEITGSESKIDGLTDVLRPFGIMEMARTGAVAMVRTKRGTNRRGNKGSETSPRTSPHQESFQALRAIG